MTSVLELTDWLDKQRRGYHKHDGFPEHPVRVKHHQEYFAAHAAEPDQPSLDTPKKDISDIYDDIETLLIDSLQEDAPVGYGYPKFDSIDFLRNLRWGDVDEKREKIGKTLDRVLSDEGFSQLLQGLNNSHSPEREVLEAERDRLRFIVDAVSLDPDEEETPEETREQALEKYEEVREEIQKINDKEHFIKDVVLGTRPISLLMENIDTLVNSDKWYMQETVTPLMEFFPTADFIMDIVNNEELDFKMGSGRRGLRTNALLALDAKRFDEVMSERYGSDWLDIEDWTEDFKMGDVRIEVLGKQRKVKELHKAFGRDAVNHFIEHLEFPDDVQFDVEDTFNVMKTDPGEDSKNLFIELYRNTQFGTLHKASMLQWEASSSSDWAGLLKESIGRQLDGDIVHHSGVQIPQLQEMYLPSRPQRLTDFGYDTEDHIKYVTTQDHLDTYVRTHQKAIRKILDSVYKDQDYIPIYRGTGTGGEVDEYSSESLSYIPASQDMHDLLYAKFPGLRSDAFRLLEGAEENDRRWAKQIADSFYTSYTNDIKFQERVDGWGEDGQKIVEWLKSNSSTGTGWNPIAVIANPVSSYSLDVGVAHKFSKKNNGWMISSLVHKDDIWSNFWSHSYAGNEREFLIINKEREAMGVRAEQWDEQGRKNSLLASDYNKYGFLGGEESEFKLNQEQRNYVTNATKRIASTTMGQSSLNSGVTLSIVQHKNNINALYSMLTQYMIKDNMPASLALEIFNDAKNNAGWRKNPNLLQDKKNLVALANQIEAWTQVLENKAGKEIGNKKWEDEDKKLENVTDFDLDDWDDDLDVEKSEWLSKQSSRTMLVPYRTMVHRPTKTPYFATRWKRVTVPQRTGTAYNVIPVEEYKGNIQDIYSSWQGYVGDREEGRHDLYLPIIALQEIIYKGYDGLLATFNNRIVGVVSLQVNQASEARLSILSASPFDIIQGTENRIEDMLRRGVEIYVKNKGWDYIGIDGEDEEDIDLEKARGQLIPVKVPITLPSGKKTEAIRWKKGKSDPKAYADFDDVFEALKDDPKMKEYLEGVITKVPSTWQRETLELDMTTGNNVIARAINSFGKWSYIHSTEKAGEKKEAKHNKVEKFNKALPKIRNDIERGMKKGDEEAIILHLIDVAGLRIGDEINNGEAFDRTQPKGEDGEFPRVPTYAARQLLGKHVSVDGTKVRLQYPGKDNVPIDKTIDNALLAKFFSDKKKTAGDDDKLFEPKAGKVRGYFQKLGGGNPFKVHNFRHHHATRLIVDKLKDYPMPTVDSEDISKAVRRLEVKQFKAGGRKKLSQADRKKIVVDYVAKQFKKHQLEVAKTSAEFLAHTPQVSFDDYILSTVWAEWDKEQGNIVREHLSTPEPEPKKVRKIKRTTVKKQDDYNPDEYQPWEDMDDLFERNIYDEESTLDEDDDLFPEDEEEREVQEKEGEESDEGWQYPIDLSKSTASVAEAKRRGLVPQSGDWQKPRRWVRPKDTKELRFRSLLKKFGLVKLPEDTWKYFNKVPNTILVDIDKLIPSHVRPDGIIEANKRLQLDTRRNPISLQDNGDGTYTILDGNSTYANAIDSEWKELPGVVVEEEKPRKKASLALENKYNPHDDLISEQASESFPFIFSEFFTVSDLQDIYSIGLEDYSTEITQVSSYYIGHSPGTNIPSWNSRTGIKVFLDITDSSGEPVGSMFRTFSRQDGKLRVRHHSFYLEDDFQGKGISADIMEYAEKQYERLGVHEITLDANAAVGGYAWASQGYDFATDKDRERIKWEFQSNIKRRHTEGTLVSGGIENQLESQTLAKLLGELDSFEHSWEFASWNPEILDAEHGEHLGKDMLMGSRWDAVKILDKKYPGYQRGKIYFALKRKHNEQG